MRIVVCDDEPLARERLVRIVKELSLIHTPSPRDVEESRMPSSA